MQREKQRKWSVRGGEGETDKEKVKKSEGEKESEGKKEKREERYVERVDGTIMRSFN